MAWRINESAARARKWINCHHTLVDTLPLPIAGYEVRKIFDADEAGVFINVQPEKSLCFKVQTCKDGEKSKRRVTILFCCNVDGSEKKHTAIGRFEKPRCFKGPFAPHL